MAGVFRDWIKTLILVLVKSASNPNEVSVSRANKNNSATRGGTRERKDQNSTTHEPGVSQLTADRPGELKPGEQVLRTGFKFEIEFRESSENGEPIVTRTHTPRVSNFKLKFRSEFRLRLRIPILSIEKASFLK